jgi:hypothetical protein
VRSLNIIEADKLYCIPSDEDLPEEEALEDFLRLRLWNYSYYYLIVHLTTLNFAGPYHAIRHSFALISMDLEIFLTLIHWICAVKVDGVVGIHLDHWIHTAHLRLVHLVGLLLLKLATLSFRSK